MWAGYIVIALGVLPFLASPFTLVARYQPSGTVSAYEPGNPDAGTDSHCAIQRYEVVGESVTGIDLFTFATVTDWCWDSSGIINTPILLTDVDTILLFWEYRGILNSGGVGGTGDWSHWDYAQARFGFCTPFGGVYPA